VDLALSGQGVRDVTRIAAGDPALWRQIIQGNADAVRLLLGEVRTHLDDLIGALDEPDALDELLRRGVAGTQVIPGKHGGPAEETAPVYVSVPDHPGELARLFHDVGADRHEHRGPAHRPRPRASGRSGRARGEGHVRGAAPGRSRGEGLGRPPVGSLPVYSTVVPTIDPTIVPTIVVAMDGPSGSGKSSTSRGVAAALGLRYLDTGAQFRAMTKWMLDNDIDVTDHALVATLADRPVIASGTHPQDPTITVDGVDVATAIRTQEVTAAVSDVASVPEVRARLLALQRSLIGDGGIVVEGRDIGSVVWPGAEVKVYLTADPSARAVRRTAENGAGSVDATEADLIRRDAIDSGRATAPLTVPADAVHIDTTPYTLQEVVDRVVALVRDTVGVA
jgi:cytidylate kinase